MPVLPIVLKNDFRQVDVLGLVDSGGNINVLPWNVGLALGEDWGILPHEIQVSTLNGLIVGKVLFAKGFIAGLRPIPLIFAWVRTDDIPIVLGQFNFFDEIDVFFCRSRSFFNLSPRP